MDIIPYLSQILLLFGMLLLITLSITYIKSRKNKINSTVTSNKIDIREYYRNIVSSYKLEEYQNSSKMLKKRNQNNE